MTTAEIEALIRAAFPDAEVEVTDLAGDGEHYAARVTSGRFRGLSRVRQHQQVYQALGGRMGMNSMRSSSRPRRRIEE